MENPSSSNTPSSPETTAARGPRSPRGSHESGKRGVRRGDRGRGGPRGRGPGARGRGHARNASDHQHVAEVERRAVTLSNGQPPTNTAQSTAQDLAAVTSDGDAEICFICASTIIHHAVAPCNHRTCHICALRLRALYKTKACAHCRTNSDYVVFTDDPAKDYQEYAPDDFAKTDDTLGIKYEKDDIFEDTVLLLRFNCPDESCDMACYGWPDLHRHVRNVHHKVMCDLCTRNKKVFTHEHDLFTQGELRKHEKFGDDNPGAIDQSGFKGHPECGFCRQRFYGDDELYAHCRDKHERCHICDRQNTGNRQQYYLDYNQLELHFSKDHYLCPDRECLEKKFVVFDSEMDLKAHQLETHPNGLSKDARRDARRVDMSGFDYRSQHQEQQRGSREGRGRGRGRDPNANEPLPVSSAQPLRRDELAYQRQRAIQSAQSVTTRTFGGQLTSGGAYTARPPTSTTEPSTVSAPRHGGNDRAPSPPPVDSLSLSDHQPATSTNQNLGPQERARALRHASLNERASTLLKNDAEKLTAFRARISSYRNNSISAASLIDNFFTLFDCSTAELGILIKELADIFEVPGKRDDLLKAWNDWKAINEDYPSLPGANGLPAGGTGAAGSGGKRILKLKSSTAQSSRSAAGRQASWGSAFPPMPAPAAAAGSRASGNQAQKAAWGAAASQSSASRASPAPAPTTTRTNASSSNSNRTAPLRGVDAFPALPVAEKPGMNVSRPGYMGNPVKRNNGSGSNTPINAWGSGTLNHSNLAAAVEAAVDENDNEEVTKGRGKGKKKQTLIHWG